jgi:phage terminase large subunit GpA-like protein
MSVNAASAATSPNTAPPHWALAQFARLMQPRRRLTVSEWADTHRILSPKASSEPGPWRTSRNELLREIMDALSLDATCPRVVVMKPGQAGATECAVNWVGYVAEHVRIAKPMAIIVPGDKLRDDWVVQRLRPMFESTAALKTLVDVSKSRDGSNRLDRIDYPGGILFIVSAGSGSNLESRPIANVVADEIDRFGWDVDGRGDPLSLIATRQANFPRRKTLLISTPQVKGSSRIEQEWEASDQRLRYVACPHCDEYQTLRWEQLQWTADAEKWWYVCPINGCLIEERDKPRLLARGEWRPTFPGRPIRGYHWNNLYNPIGLGYGWGELIQQWLKAQGNEEALQVFYNERLGQPFEDQRTSTRPDDLAQRAEAYALRTLPEGALLLTAGVDTQDDRLEVQILGWGEGGRWWVVDYVALPGNPDRPDVWTALTDLLGRAVAHDGGGLLRVEATAIDMAGHNTEHVKAFVRSTRLPRCLAIQGSRHRLDKVLGPARKIDFNRAGKIIKQGMRYHQVGTELAKDSLFRALRGDADQAPADRRAHFSQDLPPEYYQGLLSEAWNPRRQRYEPRRGQTRRNEPLDTWVYAYAAAHHPEIRLDRLRESDWKQRAKRLQAEPSPFDSAQGPASVETGYPAKPAPKTRREQLAKDGWEL